MLHRNAAQKRPGKKPSASQAFQQLPRAQIPANSDTPCQLSRRQPDATTAMEGSAGATHNMHKPDPRPTSIAIATGPYDSWRQAVTAANCTSHHLRSTT